MPAPIWIAIAEDNVFLLRTTLDKLSLHPQFKTEHIAPDGQQLLDQLAKDRIVDLVLMDIEMPRLDGIEATRQVKALYPQIKVLVLTVFDDDDRVFRAIQAGADGYLLKDVTAARLATAIQETLAGGVAMTPSIAAKTLRLLRNATLPPSPDAPTKVATETPKLTKREIQVLEQIASGLYYEAIATNLCISKGTVRKHVDNIFEKLQVHNKIEAMAAARGRGIL